MKMQVRMPSDEEEVHARIPEKWMASPGFFMPPEWLFFGGRFFYLIKIFSGLNVWKKCMLFIVEEQVKKKYRILFSYTFKQKERYMH